MKTLGITLVVAFFGFITSLSAQENKSSPSIDLSAQRSDECSFLIRIDRDLIEPPMQHVQSRDPVDRMILGTRAIGTSQTVGTMRVVLDERSEAPAINILFDGQTYTWTNGRNGPATIRCRTATTSHCSRRIVFTLDRGFVAHPPHVSTTSHLVVDQIQTELPGLRGRLVRRVAQRRSQESYGQAKAIVDQQTKADIRREFETSVDQYLVALNQQFTTVRQLATLSGEDAKLRMKLVDKDGKFIVLYLAKDGETDISLPKLGEAQAKAEVWLKKPSLPSLPSVPSTVTALLGRQVPGVASLLAVTPLMKIPAAEKGEKIGYRTEGDWTVIGVNSTRSPIAHRPAQPASRRLASTGDAPGNQ